MEYKKKYIKYKCKYLENQLIGGVYNVGDESATTLIDSKLTLVQAHGSINISKWYMIPKNVYILTTSEIGGITCGNYNEVFRKLVNDTNDRKNLNEILKTLPESKTFDERRIAHTIYKGGNIIYEPYDLIPTINLLFSNSDFDNSLESIYGIFSFPDRNLENENKNLILNEYDNLLRISEEVKDVRRNYRLNIGK